MSSTHSVAPEASTRREPAPGGAFGIRADYRHGGRDATREARRDQYWTWVRRHTHQYFQAGVYRLARDLVQREALRSVLDAGCGLGYKLRRYVSPHVVTCVGLDLRAPVRFWPESEGGTTFREVDLEAPDLSMGQTFDLLMAVEVAEHLDDPDQLLTLMKAHAHERSMFLFSTPAREILRGPENLESPKAEHVREWDRQEFRRYLESRGFVVEQHLIVQAYDLGASPVMWMYRARDLLKGVPAAHTQVVVGKIE